jgi:hypothetical protein
MNDQVVVAHLRGNVLAARTLRQAIDKALGGADDGKGNYYPPYLKEPSADRLGLLTTILAG